MSRNSNDFPRQFGSNGCPVIVEDNRQCGETQTLEIINEFKNLYESKMKQIDSEAGGDCLPGLQAKINLQQEWIRDLTEQNEMLVRVVEELEVEATDRVAMLEEKLRNSAQCGAEVVQKYRDFNFSINLDETFQKLVYLQNDVRNLLEFIRRARDENLWNTDGLQFYDVTYEDLFGTAVCVSQPKKCLAPNEEKMKQKLEEKETQLSELENKLSRMPNENELEELSLKLKQRNEDLNSLKRSMLDMRNVLTIEVAEKHDVILNLRRDIQQLEEQCRQSNKQTQFRDDIIKELRKEIKVLKAQKSQTEEEECEELRTTVDRLKNENKDLKEAIQQANHELELLNNRANDYLRERDSYKRMHQESSRLLETLSADFSKEKEEYQRKLSISQSIDSSELDKRQDTIDKLQKELENLKKEHTIAMDQVIALNNENKEKTEKLEKLQESLKERDKRQVSFTDGTCSYGKGLQSTTPSTETTSWYTTDSDKSGTEQLEETIGQLSGTVNKIMEKSKSKKHAHQCECVTQLEGELKKAVNERGRRNQEVSNLKQTIIELEKALNNMQVRADNLQKAVDLYQNSVNVLEASEERSRLEISQMRTTIANLQEALIAAKQQLNEMQQKTANEVSSSGWTYGWFSGSKRNTSSNNNDNDKSVHNV